MSAQWDMSDFYLSRMLSQMIGSFVGEADLTLCLYQNDPTLVPGIGLGTFTEADYPGYARLNIAPTDWGSVSVTSNVAISTSSNPLVFIGDPGSWSPQNIYGYFVIDWDSNYFYAERFDTMLTVAPGGGITVTPRLKHATFPY